MEVTIYISMSYSIFHEDNLESNIKALILKKQNKEYMFTTT